MYTILASIRLRTEAEGGLANDVFSGMRPAFRVAGELVTCEVFTGPKGTPMKRGEQYDVTIQLPYGEMFREHLQVGYAFELNTAKFVIGEGRITGIPEQAT
jgi:hypothetical protein